MGNNVTGKTQLLALFGSPVSHSGSPAMYNYSYDKLGLDYIYVTIDVKEDQMEEALSAMKLYNMKGGNVTMPCKNIAAKLMDELSPAAELMGAVNTIVNENGKLIGHNTDGIGFVDNLRDHGVEVKGKKITIAGGGGAATAIQTQCALDGAKEITIFNKKDAFFERTLQTAEKLKNAVKGLVVNVYDIDDTAKMTEEINSSDIFVNATIVGMKPMDDQSVVKDTSAFRPELVVCDVVYNPIETKLLKEAKAAGCSRLFEPLNRIGKIPVHIADVSESILRRGCIIRHRSLFHLSKMGFCRFQVPVFKITVCLAEMVLCTLTLEKTLDLYFGKHLTGSLIILSVKEIHGMVPLDLRYMHRMGITGHEGFHGGLISQNFGADLAQDRTSFRVGNQRLFSLFIEKVTRAAEHRIVI